MKITIKIGELVTVAPAMTGMYLIVGEKFITDTLSVTPPIDCWLLFSAEDGWILPMGKVFVKSL
jgi:hypothetical protein